MSIITVLRKYRDGLKKEEQGNNLGKNDMNINKDKDKEIVKS